MSIVLQMFSPKVTRSSKTYILNTAQDIETFCVLEHRFMNNYVYNNKVYRFLTMSESAPFAALMTLDSDNDFRLTLMMTSAQVVETSVNVTSNSPSRDYTHPDDHNLPNYVLKTVGITWGIFSNYLAKSHGISPDVLSRQSRAWAKLADKSRDVLQD